MIDLRAAALIAVCAGVTMLLRFLPFLVFGGKKEEIKVIGIRHGEKMYG